MYKIFNLNSDASFMVFVFFKLLVIPGSMTPFFFFFFLPGLYPFAVVVFVGRGGGGGGN